MKERSLDSVDRQRQEARKRLLAAKRAASFRHSSATESADSIEIYMKIMASGPTTSWERDGETVETDSDLFFWAPKSLQMVTAAMKLKDAYSLA